MGKRRRAVRTVGDILSNEMDGSALWNIGKQTVGASCRYPSIVERLKKDDRMSAGADETRLLPRLGAENNASVTTAWCAWS